MRKLNSQDVFKAFRLVTKSGLKDKLNTLIEDISKNGFESVEKAGFIGIMSTLEVLTEETSERLFYELLANPFEMTAKEVSEMDIDTMTSMLKELAKENNLKSFFTALSGLMNKKS